MANELTRSIEGMPREVGNTLADILERVLDKGVVIAGDIVIQLADIDLLTIKIRLLVTSVDKAREMGIDWWENDSFLSSGADRKQIEAKDVKDRRTIDGESKKNKKKI